MLEFNLFFWITITVILFVFQLNFINMENNTDSTIIKTQLSRLIFIGSIIVVELGIIIIKLI